MWDCGHPYELLDLQLPISPDSPTDYKIWSIIQLRVPRVQKMQDVKDLMQRLIDAWAGVEDSIIQDIIDHWRRRRHTCIQPQEDIMNIHCDKN